MREKIARRKFKEIEMYESGLLNNFEGRIRKLSMLSQKSEGLTNVLSDIPWYMIHPKSRAKKTWNIFMVFVLLYTATVMPYRIAFVDGLVFDDWWYVDNVFNIIFFLDFLSTCLTANYISSHVLNTKLSVVFMNYLKSWMLIDIISFIPLDMIIISQEGKSKNFNNLIRLLRLPRLYRLLKLSRLAKYFQNKQGSIFEFLSLKQSAIKLLSFFFTVGICSHVMSCLFFLAAKFDDFSPQSWVWRYNYLDKSSADQYIASLYWAYTTLTTVGYGDITPGTDVEIIIALLWMVFGICFFSYTIGALAAMLSEEKSK
jgi:hypothetical protein